MLILQCKLLEKFSRTDLERYEVFLFWHLRMMYDTIEAHGDELRPCWSQ